jgi:cyd operon protein YbgT
MWYFSWILGLALAAAFSVLNALWLEVHAGPPEASAGSHAPSR